MAEIENDAPTRNEESINLEERKQKRSVSSFLKNTFATKKCVFTFLLLSVSAIFMFVGVRYLQIATGTATSLLPRKVTNAPSNIPTLLPTWISTKPSVYLSQNPTLNFTNNPSFLKNKWPSQSPSEVLSSKPTNFPSRNTIFSSSNASLGPTNMTS